MTIPSSPLHSGEVLFNMLHFEYFMFPTPFRDQRNRLCFPLSAAHRGFDSKDLSSNRLLPLNRRLQRSSWPMASNRRLLRGTNHYWIKKCTETVRLHCEGSDMRNMAGDGCKFLLWLYRRECECVELLPGHLVIAETEGERGFDTNQHVSTMLTLLNRNTHGISGWPTANGNHTAKGQK